MADNDGTLVDGDGEASDWIEIFNASSDALDLAGYFLTDDAQNLTKWQFPSVQLEQGGFLVVFASRPEDEHGQTLNDYVDGSGYLHANFRLASEGEYLALVEPNRLTVAAEFNPYPKQRTDVSYGRDVLSQESFYYVEPTPGSTNATGYRGFVADTQFDNDRGFYDAPFEVRVTTVTPGATLVYTTDGTAPTLTDGTVVPSPSQDSDPLANVAVSTTTTLRAAAFRPGYVPSNVDTQTYLFLQDVIHQPARISGIPGSVDLEVDPDVVNDPRFADEIVDALRSIPTMSIVLDPDDLFGTSRGIYTHPNGRGMEWERPASMELILPDGSAGFQEDAGLRLFGATTRFLPKKPFRLSFREQYGKKKLDYPLFPDAPVGKFDNIVLRAQQTNSWQRPGRTLDTEQADFLEDTWARDTAAAMGKLDGHSTFIHLYLNGLYWGLYNPVERPDSSFGEEYLGGTEEDYDAINRRPVEFNGEGTVAIDGDLEAWRELMRLAATDLSVPENYEAIQQYISVDNVIQQFLIHQFMGHRDGPDNGHLHNNMRLIRKREPGEPFYAFVWDMEYSFVDLNDDLNVDFAPARDTLSVVYDALRAHPEFRMRYADLAHRYLFNGGALTTAAASSRYDVRAEFIEQAIIGESARWGDVLRNHLRPGEPFNRDDDWAKERERMLTEYFPQRPGILLEQLTRDGLYPDLGAPRFFIDQLYQHGGPIQSNSILSFGQEANDGWQYVDVVSVGQPAEIYVPSENEFADDLSWTTVAFDVSNPQNPWGANGGIVGPTGIGFDTGNGRYDDLLATDIRQVMTDKLSTSVLLRQSFSVDPRVERLRLDVQYDDGFVAFINGSEIARGNAGDISIPATARATASRESTEIESFTIDLREIDLREDGDNVLAIQLLNQSAFSNDLLIVPRLRGGVRAETMLLDDLYFTLDGTDPRGVGGELVGRTFRQPVLLTDTTHVMARTHRNGHWSALTEATFTVDSNVIVVTEVNYNPHAPSVQERQIDPNLDNDAFEFIELQNRGSISVALQGIQFIDGIEFDFPPVTLAPGEIGVVVKDITAFQLRYGDQVRVLGAFDSGQLSNGGERVTLADANGNVIATFAYDDRGLWPRRADGAGGTLELIDASQTPLYDKHYAWRPSSVVGGTPGTADSSFIVTGDFNDDGRVGVQDIDLLFGQIGKPDADPKFDLTDDGGVDESDRDFLVLNILGTTYGDANVDGIFNSSDLVLIFQAGEFESRDSGSADWSSGDWDGDGDFDTADFVLAFQTGAYTV